MVVPTPEMTEVADFPGSLILSVSAQYPINWNDLPALAGSTSETAASEPVPPRVPVPVTTDGFPDRPSLFKEGGFWVRVSEMQVRK